jgi:formylglycine-generating enzyme required for sulfatase activity
MQTKQLRPSVVLQIAAAAIPLITITSFARAITIDTVPVGNAGNAPDTRYDATGFGSVGYHYRIGKYEVTAGQYTEFLNAVAQDDPNELYNIAMGIPINTQGANIQRSGSSPNYSYSVAADWADRPVGFVSFWDAARFANWLHNGQPTGAQGPGTTEDGAYHDVGNQALFGRNAGARFFIPTEDEWYKAAYHDKNAGLAANYFDYPTGTIATPGNDITETTNPGNNANYVSGTYAIGSPYYRTVVGEFELSDSPYGTFDQGGNVWEWHETAVFSSTRGLRGGSFDDSSPWSIDMRAVVRGGGSDPPSESSDVGFRVASIIPEPSSLLLISVGFAAVFATRRVCKSPLERICRALTEARQIRGTPS